MRSDNPDKTVHSDKILPPDDRTMIAGLGYEITIGFNRG